MKYIRLLFILSTVAGLSASETQSYDYYDQDVSDDEGTFSTELAAVAAAAPKVAIGRIRPSSAPVASTLKKEQETASKEELEFKQAARDTMCPQREFCGNAEGPGGYRAKSVRLEELLEAADPAPCSTSAFSPRSPFSPTMGRDSGIAPSPFAAVDRIAEVPESDETSAESMEL